MGVWEAGRLECSAGRRRRGSGRRRRQRCVLSLLPLRRAVPNQRGPSGRRRCPPAGVHHQDPLLAGMQRVSCWRASARVAAPGGAGAVASCRALSFLPSPSSQVLQRVRRQRHRRAGGFGCHFANTELVVWRERASRVARQAGTGERSAQRGAAAAAAAGRIHLQRACRLL